VDQRIAACAACGREYATRSATQRLMSETLVRYAAPDILRARVRAALARPEVRDLTFPRPRSRWRLGSLGLVIAAAASAMTFAVVRRPVDRGVTDELLASHVRSLTLPSRW
jgi:hypothetical protein